MSTPQVKFVDVQTGEETVRDMNATELAQLAKDIAEREATTASDAAAKAAAEAKLAALGLTTDDLKALGLGGNE